MDGNQIGRILERISDGFVAFDADLKYTHINARRALLDEQPSVTRGT